MRRTRIPALLLSTFALAGLLAGCGSSNDNGSKTNQGSTSGSTAAALPAATLNGSGSTF